MGPDKLETINKRSHQEIYALNLLVRKLDEERRQLQVQRDSLMVSLVEQMILKGSPQLRDSLLNLDRRGGDRE